MKSIDQILNQHKQLMEHKQLSNRHRIFTWIGLKADGRGYVYELRPNDDKAVIDKLKKADFHYIDRIRMWVGQHTAEGVDTVPIDFNDYVEYGKDGRCHFKDSARHDIKQVLSKNCQLDAGFFKDTEGHVNVSVHLTGGHTKVRDDGNIYLLLFKDDEGHQFSWYQSRYSADLIRDLCRQMKTDQIYIEGRVRQRATEGGISVIRLFRCNVYIGGEALHDLVKRRLFESLTAGRG